MIEIPVENLIASVFLATLVLVLWHGHNWQTKQNEAGQDIPMPEKYKLW